MSQTPKRRAPKNRSRAYPNLAVWRAQLNLNQREAALVLGMSQSRSRAYPNLAVWRAQLNLNQREAALVLGMSQSKYSRIERGLYAPVRGLAKRIIAKTGVPLEVIVGVA